MSNRRAAVVVGAVVIGTLAAAMAAVAVVVVLRGVMNPQATRPCEESYAQQLARDPIFSLRPVGAAAPEGSPLGGCEDSDGGGVSYAQDQLRVDSTADPVIDAYARAARSQGWQGVRRITVEDPEGIGLCAHRTQDGHDHDLRIVVDGRQVPRGAGVTVTIELFGDAGDFPSC